MSALVIQAPDGKGWGTITSIKFDPSAERTKGDTLSRKDAMVEARRQVGAWSLYHEFHGVELRIVEGRA